MKKLSKIVSLHGACEDAQRWCDSFRGRSLRSAWETCPRGDWMLWIAAKIGVDRKLIVRAACACARLALPHNVPEGELRPLRAIETAEAWCRGEETVEQVRVAARAAWAANADAAYYAARAAYFPADAFYAASYAANAAACDSAALRVRVKGANAVRELIPWETMKTEQESAQ